MYVILTSKIFLWIDYLLFQINIFKINVQIKTSDVYRGKL